MGILIGVNFEVIEPKSTSNSYHTLASCPWGRKMKANISLNKDRIKIKGSGKKFIIPLDPREGKLWDEPVNEDKNIHYLYQIK